MKLNKTQTQKNNNTLFMNLSKKIAATALMFIAFVSVANAQMEAQVISSATATIINPITLTQNGVLSFGNIIPKAEGTVVITPFGQVSATGAEIAQIQKGSQTAARYDVSGERNFAYTISLPTSNVLLTKTGTSGTSAVTMIVNAFEHNVATPTLDSEGKCMFNVGATLNVAANQDAGVYTGEYVVKVNYN
jgi:hypothetical protein